MKFLVSYFQVLSALLQLHLHSPLNTWLQYTAQRQLQCETRNICVFGFGAAYIRDFTVIELQVVPYVVHEVNTVCLFTVPPCLCMWDINSLRPRQNGRHFVDDIFKCIFLNKNVWIPITISLKFVPKGPTDNMMVRFPTNICVSRPQWVNTLWVISDVSDDGYISLV